MKVGFTGTQHGMTEEQRRCLTYVLQQRLDASELHHGDCIGADAQADTIARTLGIHRVLHPPLNKSKRAFCVTQEVHRPKAYLDRNHDIVDETDILIAAPAQSSETLRSGTWATIRYARKRRRDVMIIQPNGRIRQETNDPDILEAAYLDSYGGDTL